MIRLFNYCQKNKPNGRGESNWSDKMSSLASINTQLLEVERHMNAANLRLDEKRKKLERLGSALAKLDASKSDYFDNYGLCLEPEFSPKTFHGNNADDLDTLKSDELLVSYVALYYGQINEVKETIDDKVEELTQDIATLESSISSLETQHANLKEEKREVRTQ